MKFSFPKKKSHRASLVAGLVLVGALIAWTLRPDPAPALVSSPAVLADIEQTVVATGAIEARELVSVGAQASGQITSLAVELGDQVNAGDLIAEIDATTQKNALRNSEAALANVRAQRAAQVATLRQGETAFTRQETLFRAEATSRAEYESARAVVESARAQVDAVDAQIEQAQTSLDTARANLGYTRITAPIDGTVVAIVAREGQTVNANQATPTIIRLAQLDRVTVKAEISEADVIRVKAGQPVYFTILGDPDTRYEATLRTIEPAPSSIENEATATTAAEAIYYNALFDVDNPDGVLRISMTAQVYIVLAKAERALTIPAAALVTESVQDHWTVAVLDEKGRPATRQIVTGINNNVTVEVLEGLSAGENVVVGEVADAPDASARKSSMVPPRGMP